MSGCDSALERHVSLERTTIEMSTAPRAVIVYMSESVSTRFAACQHASRRVKTCSCVNTPSSSVNLPRAEACCVSTCPQRVCDSSRSKR